MAKRDWSRVVASDRKRKRVELTLSDEARAKLAAMTAAHPTRTASRVVEGLILGAA